MGVQENAAWWKPIARETLSSGCTPILLRNKLGTADESPWRWTARSGSAGNLMAYYEVLEGVLVKAGVAGSIPTSTRTFPTSPSSSCTLSGSSHTRDWRRLDQTCVRRRLGPYRRRGDRGEVVATKSSMHAAIGGRAGSHALPIGLVFAYGKGSVQ